MKRSQPRITPYRLMDLKALIKKHHLKIRGLIQIGACNGEEVDMWDENRIEDVIFIDANPITMQELTRKVGDAAYHALIWNADDLVIPFTITDYIACSTANPIMAGVNPLHRIDMLTITLRTFLERNHLDPKRFNTLWMDVEASELQVLEGADLSMFDYVYTEFQVKYSNTPEALAAYLTDFVEVERVTREHSQFKDWLWGDILFVRKTLMP